MPPMSPVEVPVRHLGEVVCCDAIWASVVGPADASTCHTGNDVRVGYCVISLLVRFVGYLVNLVRLFEGSSIVRGLRKKTSGAGI